MKATVPPAILRFQATCSLGADGAHEERNIQGRKRSAMSPDKELLTTMGLADTFPTVNVKLDLLLSSALLLCSAAVGF